MKQEKLSILFPRQDEVTYREIPEESWHDLGLDAITERIAAKPQEIPLIRRCSTISCATRRSGKS